MWLVENTECTIYFGDSEARESLIICVFVHLPEELI